MTNSSQPGASDRQPGGDPAASASLPPLRRPIWIVEDSDEDYEALMRALAGVAAVESSGNFLRRVASGDDCLDLLEHVAEVDECGSSRGKRPALILLDLNLPGTDGREVLQFIKGRADLKCIPVAVLTTSSNPGDIDACYRDGANSYIIKSLDFNKFCNTVQLLVRYWLEATALP